MRKKNKNFTAKIMYLEKVFMFNNFKRVIAAIIWYTWFILGDPVFTLREIKRNDIFEFK